MTSTSSSIITDPTQQRLSFAPPPNPTANDDTTGRPPKIPTARNSPHLTQVQLRLARRRYLREARARERLTQSLPPTPIPEVDHQMEQQNQVPNEGSERTMIQRRCKRRRTQSLQEPQPTHQPLQDQTVRASTGTLPRFWTNEEDQRRLHQGSWRPP